MIGRETVQTKAHRPDPVESQQRPDPLLVLLLLLLMMLLLLLLLWVSTRRASREAAGCHCRFCAGNWARSGGNETFLHARSLGSLGLLG
jgi:hypothetical protein